MSLPSDFLVTEHQFCRLPPKGLNGVMIKEKHSVGLPESRGEDGGMAKDFPGQASFSLGFCGGSSKTYDIC